MLSGWTTHGIPLFSPPRSLSPDKTVTLKRPGGFRLSFIESDEGGEVPEAAEWTCFSSEHYEEDATGLMTVKSDLRPVCQGFPDSMRTLPWTPAWECLLQHDATGACSPG
ncbi:hypothetical protein XENOCAPTIV_006511 [Xenoophorus captivus]|uniref:Uncharacterized protein n=1 Tax=Xenoophorus captivus TaxID=1517983 RepID=A0ABV0QQD8_9TELE